MKTTRAPLFRCSIAIVPVLFGTGCATVLESRDTWPHPSVFGGTRLNIAVLHGRDGPEGWLIWPLRVASFVDFPFSVVCDTVLLPVSLASRRPDEVLEHTYEDEGFVTWNRETGLKVSQRTKEGFILQETRWNREGKVAYQILTDTEAGTLERKHAPPWWWGMRDQTGEAR